MINFMNLLNKLLMARNMLVLKYKCVIKLTCVEWPEPAINKEILMGIKTIQKAVLALALVAPTMRP